MDIKKAKQCLDKVIDKARVHFYKPIQIAEILYRDRIQKDIDLSSLETYRLPSRSWRDTICVDLIGRSSTSSARYQDDVFNDNATPPAALTALGAENNKKSGVVENYIYLKLFNKTSQMSQALSYVINTPKEKFDVLHLLNNFRNDPGLKRSIDKVYEIITYSLFSTILNELSVTIHVTSDIRKIDLLKEFEDFAKSLICIDSANPSFSSPAKVFRVGVTNAADRGLDMWSNFGPAIQIKHLSLDEDLAEDISSSISADRIVIVCKSADRKTILSILNQVGFKSRIQSIVTEDQLQLWYEKALRGKYGNQIGVKLLSLIGNEFINEFPSSDISKVTKFMKNRSYGSISDPFWS